MHPNSPTRLAPAPRARVAAQLRALIAFALLAAGATTKAATWQVTLTSDAVDAQPGDGVCADAQGLCPLRAAILEANALPGVDRIEVPVGTVMLSRAGSFEDDGALGDLDVREGLTLVGAGSAVSTIDAGGLDGVLDLRAVGAGEIVVRGLRLTHARVADDPLPGEIRGVGINVEAGVDAMLDDVVIDDQQASAGAGLVVLGLRNLGCVTATRLRVRGNLANDVPGARVAGIYSSGGGACLMLDQFEVADNAGTLVGGIVIDIDTQATLRQGLIAGNRGQVAAMHVNLNNVVTMDNVSLVDNRAGPALLNDGFSTVTMRHCTITGNRAADGLTTVVGGIQDVHGMPRVHLSNSIVFGNGPGFQANDCSGAVLSGGGNVIGDRERCRLFGVEANDLLDVDPGLGPLVAAGGFTRVVLPGAPAIDSGNVADCLAQDQRGEPRPRDGDGDGVAECDRGAVEVSIERVLDDGFETLVE